MRPIPLKVKKQLSGDPFMKKCCLASHYCSWGKIEWHHALIFAGRQSDIPETILPLCQNHHRAVHLFKDELDRIMLNRMKTEDIKKISKAIDYEKRKNYLNGEGYAKSDIGLSDVTKDIPLATK